MNERKNENKLKDWVKVLIQEVDSGRKKQERRWDWSRWRFQSQW